MKKLKKKIIFGFIILVTLFAILSACSNTDEEQATEDASTTETMTEDTESDTGEMPKGPPEGDTGEMGGFGGVDNSTNEAFQTLLSDVESDFVQLEYEDAETGQTLAYNLYIPENYDESQSYPLVMFMADMSVSGKETTASLEQGYGGVIWASEEEQEKHPSFVLVPQYSEQIVNDSHETTEEVDMTVRLLESLQEEYSIDNNRLYTTGQSMGGMTSIYLNIAYPDLFAGSLFVSSQWDTSVMDVLADENIFYIVAEGDPKASAGMEDFEKILAENNVTPSTAIWDATSDEETLNEKAEALISEGNNLNFVMWEEGTVLPESVEVGTSEHMYSFDYAYQVEAVRDWLFEQVKE